MPKHKTQKIRRNVIGHHLFARQIRREKNIQGRRARAVGHIGVPKTLKRGNKHAENTLMRQMGITRKRQYAPSMKRIGTAMTDEANTRRRSTRIAKVKEVQTAIAAAKAAANAAAKEEFAAMTAVKKAATAAKKAETAAAKAVTVAKKAADKKEMEELESMFGKVGFGAKHHNKNNMNV